MRMNSSIITAGQQPNIMAQAQQGYALGRQNALDSLYRQHGQGIVSGDQNALNALAQFDPMAAQKVQMNRQSMTQSEQRFKWNAEKMQMLRDQAKAETAAQAAKMSAAEAAAANEKLTGLIQAGSMYFKNGDRAGFERFAAENGLQMRFDDLPAHLARAIGTKDALDALAPPDPSDRYKTVGGQLVDLHAEGGPTPVSGIDGRSAGFSMTMPDGTVIRQGGPVTPGGQNMATTATPRDPGKLSSQLSSNDAATLKAASDAAITAADIGSLATQLETVAPNVGYTGPGGKIYGAVDDMIGVLPGDEGSRGAMRSLAMEAQLTFTEKTKGAITDREMGMFREAVPNLGQREEANMAIAQVMRAGAQRVQTRQAFLENWARKHGSLEGALEVWGEYMQDNPILDKTSDGSLKANPEGNWQAYLNRRPANAYTPQAIMQMSAADLAQIPIERMTEQQLDAMEMRFQQLGGNQ